MANPANAIQQCVQKCQQTVQELNNIANQEKNPQVKTMLTEGAHHLKQRNVNILFKNCRPLQWFNILESR